MKISQTGIDLIKELEGFRPNVYFDSAHLPTIGYGTLIDSQEEKKYLNTPITEEEATNFLLRDISHVEQLLPFAITSHINQNQYDAIVSFTYNVGINNLRKSSLLKIVNKSPDDREIYNQFMRWIYAGGKPIDGLASRRRKEAELYFKS